MTEKRTNGASRVDLKLEVVMIPVSDVGRAKRFYGDLGWRFDAEFASSDAFPLLSLEARGSPRDFAEKNEGREARGARTPE